MTKDIQKAVASSLVLRGHEAVCENFGHTVFEMDVASLSKSGMLHEFEVKISRSDFLNDKNKRKKYVAKFDMYGKPTGHEERCPNYFFYVCPVGLIKESEIPVFSGLYYYSDGAISLVRNAKKIHHIPSDIPKTLSKMLRMTVQRKYLGGTMLTHKNKEIKERNKKILEKRENNNTLYSLLEMDKINLTPNL